MTVAEQGAERLTEARGRLSAQRGEKGVGVEHQVVLEQGRTQAAYVVTQHGRGSGWHTVAERLEDLMDVVRVRRGHGEMFTEADLDPAVLAAAQAHAGPQQRTGRESRVTNVRHGGTIPQRGTGGGASSTGAGRTPEQMTMARPEGAAPSCGPVGRALRLAEDQVEICAALGAHGLRHSGSGAHTS